LKNCWFIAPSSAYHATQRRAPVRPDAGGQFLAGYHPSFAQMPFAGAGEFTGAVLWSGAR
jgi:hypothetical protein